MVWPLTAWGGDDVRTGDLRRDPDHGPAWTPPAASAEDMVAYRAQGSVCMCRACKRWREGR